MTQELTRFFRKNVGPNAGGSRFPGLWRCFGGGSLARGSDHDRTLLTQTEATARPEREFAGADTFGSEACAHI